MKSPILSIYLTFLLYSCTFAQPHESIFKARLVGGPCEGCEAIFEYGDQKLGPIDTLPTFHEGGQKIKIYGTIYQADGRTPASDVILYVYHTDPKGIYVTKGNEKNWARRHGYIRGWIKTGADGTYTFYTIKPGSYPNSSIAAHIHPTILEPNGKYYYVDEYLFAGDPFLTKNDLAKASPRGGYSGVLQMQQKGELLVAKRDFILGKNVPGYVSDRQ